MIKTTFDHMQEPSWTKIEIMINFWSQNKNKRSTFDPQNRKQTQKQNLIINRNNQVITINNNETLINDVIDSLINHMHKIWSSLWFDNDDRFCIDDDDCFEREIENEKVCEMIWWCWVYRGSMSTLTHALFKRANGVVCLTRYLALFYIRFCLGLGISSPVFI